MRLTILLLLSLLISSAIAADKQIHRITIAQLKVTRDIAANLASVKKAFAQAGREKAEWIVFPEAMLSGYYGGFDQKQVAAAFEECQALCKKHKLTGLIGTCWKANGKIYNQVRIVDAKGQLVNAYAKRCLTYGDAKWAEPGTTDIVFQVGGVKFGTLICNDLWVTPGFTDGPNPHLTLKQKKAGAQIIFQSIHSGSSMKYREYHESNLHLRAAEAGFPIVTCNAFSPPAINAASGVVGTKFEYLVQLPRDTETVQTVEVTLSATKNARNSKRN